MTEDFSSFLATDARTKRRLPVDLQRLWRLDRGLWPAVEPLDPGGAHRPCERPLSFGMSCCGLQGQGFSMGLESPGQRESSLLH
jgi:hypothetical protein